MAVSLIWNLERRKWWSRGGSGFERNYQNAGCFPQAKAIALCSAAMIGTSEEIQAFPDLPVRKDDMEAMIASYRAEYPDVPLPDFLR